MGMRLDRAGLLRRVAAQFAAARVERPERCDPHEAATCRSRLCLSMPRWLAGLSALGPVLYVPCATPGTLRGRPLPGLLVGSIDLAPLLHTRVLAFASAITADGPREWMECRDAAERALARFYLLPDTDYLAWEALCCRAAAAPAFDADLDVSQPTGARVLRFRLDRFAAGLQLLGADADVDASPLCRDVAARIARHATPR
jgi:hypothetical protein